MTNGEATETPTEPLFTPIEGPAPSAIPLTETPSTLPKSSSYLLQADAQAILEEAPNLEEGLFLLSDAYRASSWDDETIANKTMSDYGEALRQRFSSPAHYTFDDTLTIAPLEYKEANDNPNVPDIEGVNNWEQKNLDFLSTTDNPDYLPIKDKLSRSISEYASELRRQTNTKGEGFTDWLKDKYYRAELGLVGGAAKLFGAENYVKDLREHTDPSRNDDLSSDFAGAAGIVGGTLAAATAGTIVGGPVGGVLATGAYLVTTGAGEVKETYQKSIEETGDISRATKAAAIEAGAQAFMLGAGGRIFGGTGRRLASRIFKKEVTALEISTLSNIVTKGSEAAVVGAVGTAGSNAASIYGSNDYSRSVLEGVGRGAVVLGTFGGIAGSADALFSKKPSPIPDGGVIPPIESNIIGSNLNEVATEKVQLESDKGVPIQSDFKTKDGSAYQVTENGNTVRVKGDTQEVFHPLDRTFYVPKGVAEELAKARLEEPPVKIFTDGENLLVKKGDAQTISVPANDIPTSGNYPVEVNQPKNINGNNIQYQSHIGKEITEVTPRTVVVETGGGKSVGAAFTKERKLGVRGRLSKGLDESIREAFGDEESGFLRYLPKPNLETINEAEKIIAEQGVEKTLKDILSLEETEHDVTVETARQLVKYFNEGARKARAEGNIPAAENLAFFGIQAFEKAARLGTGLGRGVQIYNLFKEFDPGLRILYVDKILSDAAKKETMEELGVSKKRIEDTPKELEKVQEQIDEIQASVKTTKEGKPEKLSKAKQAKLSGYEKEKAQLQKMADKSLEKIKEYQKKFTPEQRQRMELLLAAQKETGGTNQLQLLREAYDIEKTALKDVSKKYDSDALFNYTQLNILTDPSTQIVNLGGNISQFIGTAGAVAITGLPRGNFDIGTFLKGGLGLQTMRNAVDAAILELQGVKTFKPAVEKFGEGGTPSISLLDRGDYIKNAPAFLKKTKLNYLGIAYRALGSGDALFYTHNLGAFARLKALELAKKEGLTGEALRTRLAELLFNTPANWKDALAQSEKESKILKEAGLKTSPRLTRFRAAEILEEKRSKELREETHSYSRQATYTNPPSGTVGELVKVTKAFANIPIPAFGTTIRPGRYYFRFLNMMGNLLQASIDYQPIVALPSQVISPKIAKFRARREGVKKGLSGEELENYIERKIPQDKTDLEQRIAMGKLLIGTTLTGTVYGFGKHFLNTPNPPFMVYGPGPTDKAKREQWIAEGGRPYSIKWKDRYFRYSETPLVLTLAPIGALLDLERGSKAFNKKQHIAAFSAMLSGTGKAFFDNSFLKNFANFIDAIRGDNGQDVVTALAITPAKTFIPGVGFLKSINKLIENPIDTTNDYWAKFISGIPGSSKLGTKPALNDFGEPIERTFEDRISFIGRFYSKRVTDPAWRWLSDNDYSLPKMDIMNIQIPTKGTETGEERTAKFGAIFENILTPEEAYEFKKKQGPLAKEIVREFRARYGSSGRQEEVQDELKKAISKMRHNVKVDMFLR